MSTITLPYTLTNGNNNDATQVMADFNAIAGVVNGNLDATNMTAAYTTALNGNNAFLKLFTSANLRFKYGTGTSGTLDGTAGRSKSSGVIAHGLGATPALADVIFSSVGVTEAAGAYGLGKSVIWDGTNITWYATSPGTSNNGFGVFWWCIG